MKYCTSHYTRYPRSFSYTIKNHLKTNHTKPTKMWQEKKMKYIFKCICFSYKTYFCLFTVFF